ncbi:MAG TPA: hypothetical protein VFC03_18965 [Acidimicrobiales bacterium]|nr:hypothetical protein [Acidimicrobiales bacterium]
METDSVVHSVASASAAVDVEIPAPSAGGNTPFAAATLAGWGYWLVAADGDTFAFGAVGCYGLAGGQHLSTPVVDLAPTPDGRGF